MTHVVLWCLASLLVAGACAGLSLSASAQPTWPTTAPAGDAAEAGRVYLSQSFAALQWARRHAETAARSGRPEGFDLDRYLAELGTIAYGLERYLRPEGPSPGPLTPVAARAPVLARGRLGGRPPAAHRHRSPAGAPNGRGAGPAGDAPRGGRDATGARRRRAVGGGKRNRGAPALAADGPVAVDAPAGRAGAATRATGSETPRGHANLTGRREPA